MGQVHLTRHIDATAERVFELASTADSLRAWLKPIRDVHQATGPLHTVGSRLRATIDIGGHELDTTWTVTAAEPGRFLHLAANSPDGEAELIIECGAWYGACEVDVELIYELPRSLAGQLMDRLFADGAIRRDLRQSLDELERMCSSSLV